MKNASLPLVIAGCFVIACGTLLQCLHPGDQLATALVMGGLAMMGGGYAAKHREASKARKDCVDLEKTATSLRTELFEKTGSWRD